MMRMRAHGALLLAAAFWGLGNVAQKTVLGEIGPVSAVCLRCAIAAIAILPFVCLERRMPRGEGWWTSATVVALAFAGGIAAQQVAYQSSTVTNASFLVNTDTLLTPLIAWFALRERPAGVAMFGAAITFLGIFLMSNGLFGFTDVNWGDGVCLISALFYAVWMVVLGRHAQKYGLPFSCALLQFALASVVTLPISLVSEVTTLPGIVAAAPELIMLGVFSTAAAFGLQTWAQRYTSASKAAVLVSGESVFGAVAAYGALQERPSIIAVLGAGLIMAAILMAAVVPDPKAARCESAMA